MATFADTLGGQWEIKLTAGDLKRIKKDAGVDLRDALRQDGGTLYAALDDNDRFLELMWALCGRHCQLPRDQFECLFDRDTSAAAVVALWESVWDFTRGQKVGLEARAALLAAMERSETETSQILRAVTDQIKIGQTSKDSANDSPELSASITVDLP